MKVSTMRTIDRYVGILLCWLAGLLNVVRSRRGETPLSQRPERVLIMKFFGMGSLILATPAMQIIREKYPTIHIEVLSFEVNRDLLSGYPFINEVHAVRTSSLVGFVADTIAVLRKLRSRRYDVVFDFEFFSKFSTLVSALVPAGARVGFSLPVRWRRLHLTHQVPLLKDEHVANAFCRQVHVLTGPASFREPAAPQIGPADIASMESKLPLNGKPLMAINVNAGETFVERRWPAPYFSRLVDDLGKEFPHDFYFVGLAHERDHVDRVIRGTGIQRRCFNVAGTLSLAELAAFLQRCDLLISNDGGPVHLAATLRVRTIALYGPESPEFYGPLSPLAVAVSERISCSPCMNVYAAKAFQCPYDAACMRSMSVERVRAIVEGVLLKA